MNALKIVQNAGLHCHSRPDECGEQQKYGEKRTKEAHKSSIMLKTDGRTDARLLDGGMCHGHTTTTIYVVIHILKKRGDKRQMSSHGYKL